MTVQDIIDKFNSIKDKNLEIEMVNPYRQTGKPISIDGIYIQQIGNKICFDFETQGLIDM